MTDEELRQVDEFDIRRWFSIQGIEDAADTLRVCEGIVEGRQAEAPKRRRRSDAGTKRPAAAAEQTLDLREVARPFNDGGSSPQ